MSDYPLAKYSAKIKDIYIELKKYEFFHSPYDNSATKKRFIGRDRVKDRIVSILNTNVKSGSYLVTGFRGMGKTSVVREAIDDFNYKSKAGGERVFTRPLDNLISEFVKLIRIFSGFIFTYFLVLFFTLTSDALDKALFIIISYIIFAFFFLTKIKKTLDELKGSKDNISLYSSDYERRAEENKPKTDFAKRVLFRIAVFTIFILLILIFIFVLLCIEVSRNEISGHWLFLIILPVISAGCLLAASSVIKSNEIFKAAWNCLKLIFVVVLFVSSAIFFLDYRYIYEKRDGQNSISKTMNIFFPPVNFQKKSDSKNSVTVSNFDGNVNIEPSVNSPVPKADENSEIRNKELTPQTEADIFTVILRLIIGFLFSYTLLSILASSIDFIYLMRVRMLQNKKQEEQKSYHRFEINLSQDSLEEMEILRRMTIIIENYWQGRKFDLGSNLFNRKFYFPWQFILQKLDRPRKNQYEPSYKSVAAKLNHLKNRLSGSLTTRRERKTPPNITTPIAGLFEIEMPLGTYINNDEVSYPIASVKEAEDHLREILDDINDLRTGRQKLNIPQFIFIIDELDKIDPHNSSVVQERESSNPVLDVSIFADDTNRFRQRREAVGRLLANLKGFLNVAKAKFFFIGGREMFDADLADIADRESFYSSIFNDVIYVESFFKDFTGKDNQNTGGVTQMTETYICNIILTDLECLKDQDNSEKQNNAGSKNEFNADRLNLKKLTELIDRKPGKSYLVFKSEKDGRVPVTDNEPEKSDNPIDKDEANRQKYKIISTLQNYIVYLTYRSSGTPKKLTSLTEHLIVNGPSFKEKEREENNERFFKENVVVLHDAFNDDDDLSDKLFLKFGFNTQYEIGLTSNLYRPYLIANSRHLKALGDKLLFSSSFIIDHILKFHPFGFSWRNLELIPEVVLVNREPNLREFIEELMRFYSLNYIRDTVSGIFDYKFRSIIRRELVHLSKTSDLSSAAFNFTLDESLATKRHYKRKIIELREKYKGYQPVEGDNQFIHSLYFVQTIVGDLHFYDKEYDDAILYYTESIQTLRLPNAITDRKITRHQFLLWVKNKLKLGLTLEKIRAFDSAFSIYKTLSLDTERYFKNIVSKENSESKKRSEVVNENEDDFYEAEDHRAIHLMSMPFIALLAVTEKLRNDGITYANLFTNRKNFLRTINAPKNDAVDDEKEFDKYRKYYLMADYYNNAGSILFYKNCQFTKFFGDSKFWLEAFIYNQDKNNLIINQQNSLYAHLGKVKRPYDFFPSLSPFNYYWNSLYFLLKYHQYRIVEKIEKKLKKNKKKNLTDTSESKKIQIPLEDNLLALCTAYLLPECVDMVSSNRLYYIANVVSKIGDSILASLNEDGFVIPTKEFKALDITNWDKKDEEKDRLENIEWFKNELGENLFTAETVLRTYKLAAALFKRAGYSSYYASHLTRILYVIKDLIEINKNKKDEIVTFLNINWSDKPFKKLEEIAETVFRATTWNNEVSNRPQILKYRDIFDISIKRNKDREVIYNIINNISDSKEVIVLVESIKIKLGKHHDNKDTFIRNTFTLGKNITSAYGTISNRYQRMLELKYRTERCFYIVSDVLKLGALFDKKLAFLEVVDQLKTTESNGRANKIIKEQIREIIEAGTQDKKNVTINDVVAFLIHEALFCSSQLIKMIKLYNPGYVIGFSFIAEAHSRMGAWCQAYDNYLKIIDEDIYDKEAGIYERHFRFLESNEVIIREEINLKNKMKFREYFNNLENLKNWENSKDNIEKILISDDEIKEIRKQTAEIDINKEVSKKQTEKLESSSINKDSYAYKILRKWNEKNSKVEILKKGEKRLLEEKFTEHIKELLGGEGLIYLESKNHYETAVQYYYKMIQMHSDGKTYKDKLHEIYMLEDDYNDIMAHYTIAAERVRINTGKIKKKINSLNDKIRDSKVYKYDSYLTSNKDILDGLDIETSNKYLDYFATNIKEDKEPSVL